MNRPSLEDAHEAETVVGHLRVITPVPKKKRRIDRGDLVIYGGWVMSIVAALFVLGVTIGMALR